MALDALTIATQGLLSTPDQIALQGLFEAATPPTPGPYAPGMGGSGGGVNLAKNLARLNLELTMRHQRKLRMRQRALRLLLLLSP